MNQYVLQRPGIAIEVVAKDDREANFIANYLLHRPDIVMNGSSISAGILFTRKSPK